MSHGHALHAHTHMRAHAGAQSKSNDVFIYVGNTGMKCAAPTNFPELKFQDTEI